MSLFKSLFGSSNKEKTDEKQKNEERNFDILKYDGIRAHHVMRFDYAIQCFEKALEIHEDAEVYEHLSSCYSRLGRLKNSWDTLTNWKNFEPKNPRPLSFLANIAFIQEDYQSTYNLCEQAIALDPENPYLYYLSGRAFQGLKQYKDAIEHLTKAIEMQENYTDAYISRAHAYYSENKIDKAKEDIDKILSYEPENEDTIIFMGDIQVIEGKQDLAINTYQSIISTNPFNREAYLRLGALYQKQKEWDKAIKVYDDAIEVLPEFIDAYLERRNCKQEKGDLEGVEADTKIIEQFKLVVEEEDNEPAEYLQQKQNIPF